MYTIGIKRKFWFGFKKYRVKGHLTETFVKVQGPDGRELVKDIKPRLMLRLEDESREVIPEIESKAWKIYPDFFVKEDKWQDNEAKTSISTLSPQAT